MRYVLIVLGLLGAALVAGRNAAADSDAGFDEIIVFGASMSDTGNAYILSSHKFAAPPYFTGRFSNGPVWVERLAENLGFGTPTEDDPIPAPSAAGGTNYAVGGADTGWTVSRAGAPGMGVQIESFFDDGHTLDGDELIVVQGGGNETSGVLAARNVVRHVADLAAAGGKHFLVNNHFRLSRSPAIESDGWADAFVANYDKVLAEGLDAIETKYPGIKIYRFDMLGLTDNMIANPDDYGLTNTTDPLLTSTDGSANEYMWWDDHHFTAKIHQIFADEAAELILD